MARVTVEDCVELVPNRFKLVKLASHRARALASGAELHVERDRDKNPVVALREIAEEKLELGSLEESLVKSYQKRIEPDRPEEEVVELMKSEEQGWVHSSDENQELADDQSIIDIDLDRAQSQPSGEATFGSLGGFEDVDVKD